MQVIDVLFPLVGWLIEGFVYPIITTGEWWCRWYTSHRAKPIFTERTWLLGNHFVLRVRDSWILSKSIAASNPLQYPSWTFDEMPADTIQNPSWTLQDPWIHCCIFQSMAFMNIGGISSTGLGAVWWSGRHLVPWLWQPGAGFHSGKFVPFKRLKGYPKP